MSRKTIVFIDGNNWYHNTKWMGLIPGSIDLKKLSEFVCDNYDSDLIEIRYYNSVPDISDGKRVYHKHMGFLADLRKQGIKVYTRKLQKSSTEELKRDRKILIDSMELCNSCKPIVVKGFLDVIGNMKKKEKGIDVMIAVDIIRKCMVEKKCERCILISGDADFIPAMQIIKTSGGEVISSSVHLGYSRELRDGRFRYLTITRRDLSENCMKE